MIIWNEIINSWDITNGALKLLRLMDLNAVILGSENLKFYERRA